MLDFEKHIEDFMKKTIIFALLIFVSIPLFSSQRMYDYKDNEYRLVRYILQSENLVGPHDITPISQQSLISYLEKADEHGLSSGMEKVYENAVLMLNDNHALVVGDDGSSLAIHLPVSPEMYIKLGDDAELHDMVKGYKDRLPFLELSLDFTFSDYIYGIFTLPFKMRLFDDSYYNSLFSQNIFKGGTAEPYQRVSPFKAYISAGNSFMNFFLGRGKLNMGSGKTGNLFIADNFQFQDFAKLSFFSDVFSYDYTLTSFDQEAALSESEVNSIKNGFSTFEPPYSSRVSHSFTFNILDKVHVTVSEAAVLETNNIFDIRMLNPFIFLHNWNGFGAEVDYWANNFASINLSASLGLGLRLDFQAVLDQFQLGNEAASGSQAFPNSFGFLLNLSSVSKGKNGFVEVYLEAVYTTPYLYLNNINKEGEDTSFNANRDLILGYYLTYGSDLSYTGYKWGPDTVAISIGGNYLKYDGTLDLRFAATYRIHGESGIKYSEKQNQSSVAEVGQDHVHEYALTGILEHTLQLDLGVTWQAHKSFAVSADASYVLKMNHNNHEGDVWNNLQLTLSCSFDPLAFFEKK